MTRGACFFLSVTFFFKSKFDIPKENLSCPFNSRIRFLLLAALIAVGVSFSASAHFNTPHNTAASKDGRDFAGFFEKLPIQPRMSLSSNFASFTSACNGPTFPSSTGFVAKNV
jgi:hypothetical protein